MGIDAGVQCTPIIFLQCKQVATLTRSQAGEVPVRTVMPLGHDHVSPRSLQYTETKLETEGWCHVAQQGTQGEDHLSAKKEYLLAPQISQSPHGLE